MRLGITKAESKNNCFAYLNLMYLNVYCTFWVIFVFVEFEFVVVALGKSIS